MLAFCAKKKGQGFDLVDGKARCILQSQMYYDMYAVFVLTQPHSPDVVTELDSM